MNRRAVFVLSVAVLAAGCSSLLPKGSNDAPNAFASYADVAAAVERIVPFKTATEELPRLGFDMHEGRNVTLIPYPNIVARLAPYPGVPLDALDPGIRTCILAKTACRGYLFRFERQDRAREGNFWADFFNFHRVNHYTGWWFEALVVVNDGTVLFRNIAGQPNMERTEQYTNPLGPFQPAGEGVGTVILR
jgi:hypothetical protein